MADVNEGTYNELRREFDTACKRNMRLAVKVEKLKAQLKEWDTLGFCILHTWTKFKTLDNMDLEGLKRLVRK